MSGEREKGDEGHEMGWSRGLCGVAIPGFEHRESWGTRVIHSRACDKNGFMMPYEQWRSKVVEVVRAVGDEDFQRRSWFGSGPEISSPNEMVCQVFDDGIVPEFVETHRDRLSAAELESAVEFLRVMGEFVANSPKKLDPGEVIDSAQWQRVREASKKMMKVWEQRG